MASFPPMQQYPPQPPYPYYPPVNPIAGPAKVFGIIFAVLAVLSLFGVLTLGALAVVPGALGRNYGVDRVGAAAPLVLFGVLAVIVLIFTILHAATAYGLLARKPWGRTLTIITSIFSLLSIPFGTILGGFALYFFMRNGAEQDYARLTFGQP
jgi:hypothetical protein